MGKERKENTEMTKGVPDLCIPSSLTGEAWSDQGCGCFRGVDHSVAPLFHGPEATCGGDFTGRRSVTVKSNQPGARLDTDFTPRCLSLFVEVPFQKEAA